MEEADRSSEKLTGKIKTALMNFLSVALHSVNLLEEGMRAVYCLYLSFTGGASLGLAIGFGDGEGNWKLKICALLQI